MVFFPSCCENLSGFKELTGTGHIHIWTFMCTHTHTHTFLYTQCVKQVVEAWDLWYSIYEVDNEVQPGLVLCRDYVPEKSHAT